MSDRWWEKRRKRNPWFNVFREFDRIEKMMDEMMRRAFKSFETSSKRKSFKPHVYGFSVSVGPKGKPKIRRFSNLKKRQHAPQIKEEREPLVDVLEEGEEVVVVAELPGVKKKDVNLQTSEESLTINVDTQYRKYHRKLPLPAEVDPKEAKTSYKNGVLQVRLKKKEKEGRIQIW